MTEKKPSVVRNIILVTLVQVFAFGAWIIIVGGILYGLFLAFMLGLGLV